MFSLRQPYAFAAVLLAACVACAPLHAQEAVNAPWSYDGDQDGQDTWGTLSPGFASCEMGQEQSPIIVGTTEQVDLPTLLFQYKPAKAFARNSGRGVLVSFDKPQELIYDKQVYELKHIMMHSPAEHMVKGRAFSMEFQLMHLGRDNNKKLIVAIFADIGFRPPPPVQNMIDHFPPKPGTAAVEFTMNPALLVPEYKGYMTYTGSLTTPPCTEGVKWILLKQKIGITKDQQRAISKLVGRNARLTQPTYFRVVQETREF